MSATCPHCSEEVDYLIEICNTRGWESQRIDFNGEYIDFESSETTDSDHDVYECPECGEEITGEQREEMEIEDNTEAGLDAGLGGSSEQHQEQEMTKSEKPDSDSSVTITPHMHKRYRENMIGRNQLECPKCSYVIINDGTFDIECPRCGEEWVEENNNMF